MICLDIRVELTVSELTMLWVKASKISGEMLSNPLNMNPPEQAIEIAKYIKMLVSG